MCLPILGFSQHSDLKAILIVGNLQDGTRSAIEDMEEIHTFFKNKNVKVSTFYYPKTKWEDIVKQAKDANFLVYAGHGVKWFDGKYGGFSLNKRISSKDIINDLKLKSNAINFFIALILLKYSITMT